MVATHSWSSEQVSNIHPYADEAGPRIEDQVGQQADQRASSMVNLLHSLEPALARVQTGRSILFSSARPGEGKTTLVAQFAAMLLQNTSSRVAVIDAGLRCDLSTQQEPRSQLPLVQLLARLPKAGRGEGHSNGDGRRALLTATVNTPDSRALVEQAASWAALKVAFDYVLVEMPSLADSPLALGTAKYFDGVVLVIEAGRTRWPIAQNAQVQLQRAGGTVLGAFLNKRIYHVPESLYKRL